MVEPVFEKGYPSFEAVNGLEYTAFKTPKYAWKCELHPNTYWQCEEGKQPNAFHRFMQRLCFGLKWTRIDD